MQVQAASMQNATTISGRVLDYQGQPVYAVVVSVDGTTWASYTDEDGRYEIIADLIGNRNLLVSGVGITPKKVAIDIVKGRSNLIPDIEVENSVELEEISIEGKTVARRQLELPYSISVLDVKQNYSMSTPLSKLLNNVSSVRIREEGGVGSNYDFTLNGFSGNQVKFFLDGIPMDNFGSSFNLSNISANMAERVEVYKGVLPVSLGGDALGGAVNIISRRDANYLDASYSFGSFNTHKAAVNAAYTNNNTGYTVRANTYYNYSDNNYKVYAPFISLDGEQLGNRWVERFHDGYQSGGIRLETGITNKPYADYLLAGVILSKDESDIQTGATMEAVYGGVKVKSESMIPSIRYKKENLFAEGFTFAMYGAYNYVNDYNVDTLSRRFDWLGQSKESGRLGERGVPTDSKIKNREWLANANLNYKINTHQSLTLNHVFSSINRKTHDKMYPNDESNKIPQKLTKNISGLGWQINYTKWNANIFTKFYKTNSSTYKTKDRYLPTEELVKVDDAKSNLGFGTALTYFILRNLQVKGSYEKAYRLPESTEMFGDGLIQQSNPDLKPESSNNLNLGFIYEQRLKEHSFFLEGNFIYRDTKDFILKELNSTSNPTTGYKNLGKVLTRGVEGGFKYKWKKMLNMGLSMTYQDILDNQSHESNESLVGEGITENIRYKERLPNIPYFFIHGDIGFQFQNIGIKNSELTLDYSINYVEQYYLSFPGLGATNTKKLIPTQTSHDVALGYSLEKGKYGVVLECTNISNEKLYDNYLLQKPGRAFNVKFRYFLK